ncbi:phage minor head protein [Methylopila sp. M107]|uniref:phage minor head protein n=1 Tax=Methylopila sp. M107 TaxID=1101190 RepID=UPI0003729681|nr:phage minor head protein [Methylopila sp. M107]
MTDAERRKAFNAERKAQLRRGVAIQAETYAEIVRLLELASRVIRLTLADAPSEFEQWRLEALQGEVRLAAAVFERGSLATILTGLDRSFEAGGALVTEPLRRAGIEIAGVLPSLDPRLLIAMKSFQTDRIRDISTTVVNRVNAELGQVVIGFQNPFEAVKKIAGVMDAPKARVATIVRTELGTVYSEAGQQRMEQAVKAGVDGLMKQWRRSGKLHPRLPHELADGQVVAVDQPFLVGGVKIMKPRDPSLDPKERVNCGCASLPFMKHWRVSTPGPRPYTAEEIAKSRSARQVEEIRAA